MKLLLLTGASYGADLSLLLSTNWELLWSCNDEAMETNAGLKNYENLMNVGNVKCR